VGGLDFQIKNAEDLVVHFGDGGTVSGQDDPKNPENGPDRGHGLGNGVDED
jgi:hypothetical protein